MMKQIHIRRVYTPPSEGDGVRVLVDRLWPRGCSKAHATWTAWIKEIAPSNVVRQRFHVDGDYDRFCAAYWAELEANPEAQAFRKRLREEEGTVTLLFAAKDETHNNASALRAWLCSCADDATMPEKEMAAH